MMAVKSEPLYVPALRMKAGELVGISELVPDIAARILPRLIVPPKVDRSDELQIRLFESERLPDVGQSLSTHWGGRPLLLDATYLFEEFGRSTLVKWLPRMFESAWRLGAKPIPLVALADVVVEHVDAYRFASDSTHGLKFGIVASSGELGDEDEIRRGLDVLSRIGIAPEDCLIIADFHDSSFDLPDTVAPIIGGVGDMLAAVARWQNIVFQGSNYPERNPAQPESSCQVPRNEWLAWRQAVSPDLSSGHMIFGDYAADCAKVEFKKGGAGAIRHYRYATPDAWLIQRGSEQGSHKMVMEAVCREIVRSGLFAGHSFSAGDNYIYQTSKGLAGPGSPKDWRAVNTIHHLTRVVVDLCRLYGFPVLERASTPPLEQLSLL